MQLVIIELILWAGFGLIIWALHDNLIQAETEMEERHHLAPSRPARRPYFCAPQNLMEPIGNYLDKQIYRYAVIDGRHYSFDYICPRELAAQLQNNQRFVAPGLVYTECTLT